MAMKIRRALISLSFAFVVLGSTSWSQRGVEQIRIQTTLVNVPVIVTDRQGGSVPGLKVEDFTLYDDGIRQSLAFFAAVEEPIRIALLLDTSQSTKIVLDRIRSAADGFVSQLRPQDQAMVVSFDSEVHVLCRFSSNQEQLKRAIRNAQVGDDVGTRMYDTVVQVAEKNLRSDQGRKAIVLLTDGQDYGSRSSADDMVSAVIDSGVVVYPVYYRIDVRELSKKLFGISLPKGATGGATWQENERAAEALLLHLADESAGNLYRSEVKDLKKTFARVAEGLRQQYLLAFYPDPSRVDGMQHALKVAVARPDLVVRARTSYRASAAR
jgi:VWFA-related protein